MGRDNRRSPMLGILLLTGINLTGAAILARADDWATTDGQTYRDVKVLSHDDGYVTILDSNGGARVLLRVLTPELQEQFQYDAAKAAACEAATVAADRKDSQERATERAARDRQQALSPVSTAPAAGFVPITHGPPAPAAIASKPPVDTLANNVKIEADQKELDDIAIDIRDAKRDQRRNYEDWNYHYDDTGTVHPNEVGESPEDRLARLGKRKKELEDEIKQLQTENAGANSH